jgi:hypothetical protein
MTKRYKVIINDRKYTSWSYIPEEGFDNCHKDEIDQIAPVKHFSKDILLYDPSSNTIETFFSHIRSGTPLAGILVLEDNRTYGRANKTKSKLLYKVIPDDIKSNGDWACGYITADNLNELMDPDIAYED